MPFQVVTKLGEAEAVLSDRCRIQLSDGLAQPRINIVMFGESS